MDANNKYFFTKEQFDNLYETKIHFITVRKSNCLKNCPHWLLDATADVWEERTGQKVNRNWSCSSCSFNFINMVGKYYIADMELYEKEEQEQEKEEPVEVFTNSLTFTLIEQPENDEQEQPIKRKGRPKKNEK